MLNAISSINAKDDNRPYRLYHQGIDLEDLSVRRTCQFYCPVLPGPSASYPHPPALNLVLKELTWVTGELARGKDRAMTQENSLRGAGSSRIFPS